ncbi:heparin-binding protein-like protein [Sarcoptes scabiei]|uniref:Heparin-binding protein-like protein n=1 Tax=Sarcoptes scabiei TaxID=52283 RepID=A0A132AC76_SARSC|nr:heparin-binding protein-like protein [Sarcoptes scabiei]
MSHIICFSLLLFFVSFLTFYTHSVLGDANLINNEESIRFHFWECRYNKSPWQACDSTTRVQKRILKLRSDPRHNSTNCPEEKTIERPCRRRCRYSKGTWGQCISGFRERIDKLKDHISSSDCPPEKTVSKRCRKQCSYTRSRWSACEDGFKSKTLMLIENPRHPNSPDCDSIKHLSKPCRRRHSKNYLNPSKNIHHSKKTNETTDFINKK